jgi:formylglycine-generating enzyme required for sulfatase activity
VGVLGRACAGAFTRVEGPEGITEHGEAITMTPFQFIEIPTATVDLGWRFDNVLPKQAAEAMSEFAGEGFRSLFFSPARTVSVAAFKIATTAVPWNELFSCDDCEAVSSVQQACDQFNAKLAEFGWRLPTEDEFELAAGGELFAWGNEIPEGIPYGKETTFTRHKDKTPRGLVLNDNPYNVELVSTAFKMGDGGVSICGGDPWPIAWLALSPAFRCPEEMIAGVLGEYLESTRVRPVLL